MQLDGFGAKMNNNENESASVMLSTSKNEYGGSYQDHLFEQYKLYVEMADKISDRRANANSFFFTIMTALISIIGIISGFGTQAVNVFNFWIIAVSIVGLILCYSWNRIIESYRQLNGVKFKVIHEIEKKLPLALYHREWIMLGEGNNPKLYRPLTHVEKWVPMLFALLFIAILTVGIISLI